MDNYCKLTKNTCIYYECESRKKRLVRQAVFSMKFACGNEDVLLIKSDYRTLRNASLHKFAKWIYFIEAKPLLYICRKTNAPLKTKWYINSFGYDLNENISIARPFIPMV